MASSNPNAAARPTASARLDAFSFCRIWLTCVLTVVDEMTSVAAISAVVAPRASSANTSRSLVLKLMLGLLLWGWTATCITRAVISGDNTEWPAATRRMARHSSSGSALFRR